MGKIIKDQQENGEYKDFIQGLQQMYTGTKKWGTVRVIVKRSKCLSLSFNLNIY